MDQLNKSSLNIESTPITHVAHGMESGNTACKCLVPKVQECIDMSHKFIEW